MPINGCRREEIMKKAAFIAALAPLAFAALVSIRSTRAWAWSEYRKRACSMPVLAKSAV